MRKRRNFALVWLLLAAVLMCCCCAAGAAALGKPGAPSGLSLSAQVCAGFATTPHFRVGIAWYTLISSYYPPLMMSPYVVCVEVPWSLAQAWPSMAGEVVFPP